MPEIQKACQKLGDPGKPYTPKLTIVICGKRHHTRFYPTEGQNADRDGNPLPGTVVDRGVTAVYEFDFFLQGLHYLSVLVEDPPLIDVLHSSCWFEGNHSANPLLCSS